MRRFMITCTLLCAALQAFAGAPQYQLTHKFVLGGDGGWDYLTYDEVGKRLFITRSTRVMVVDPVKGTLLAEIPGTEGVHGVALAQDLGRGFTSNGKSDSVTVFDLKTLKVLDTIKIPGQRPDAIVYEPKTRRVFTFDGGSEDATVIDAVGGKVVASIKLPGRPEAAATDGQGRVYVNIEDKSELSAIDAAKAVVSATWALGPCQEPSAIAIDAADHRVFSGCDNKLMVVSDVDAGKVVATLPIGEGVDAGVYDPQRQLVFMANGEGTLSVIGQGGPDDYTDLDQAPTRKFARTLALDPANDAIYLVTADVHVTPAPAGATGAAARPKREVQPGTFTLLVMEMGKMRE
jgi:YVTN family beta-propeller protein